MLKRGDHVVIDGSSERGQVKEIRPHHVVVRVDVADAHEERTLAYEDVRLDPTMSEASRFIDH